MPKVIQRKLSYGEIQAHKRLVAFTKSKQAKNHNKGNNTITVITPPRSEYGSLILAPDNLEV